ncbi:hypothetical protein ACP70R_039822 [Stipagrostis hirtigluma subsp. patula]
MLCRDGRNGCGAVRARDLRVITGRCRRRRRCSGLRLRPSAAAAGPHRPRHLRRGPVALRAVATPAYRASSDLLRKFNLGSNFELQPLETGRAFCKGGNSTLRIEIDDPALQAIEFLFFDEAQNKWQLPEFSNSAEDESSSGAGSQGVAGASSSATMPEDLVRIQEYLKWERNGKQSYTPDQEKECEAARAELI